MQEGSLIGGPSCILGSAMYTPANQSLGARYGQQ